MTRTALMTPKATPAGNRVITGPHAATPLRGRFGFPQFRSPITLIVALLSSLFGGCVNPQYLRYPQWNAMFPQAENLAYQRQDPFPDPDIGPSTESAPRGYDRPRSEARRAAEQRILQGVPVGPEYVPPGAPQGGLSRPRSVF